MGRKSKSLQLASTIAGQHLALSVAAHLARTQLVPDPLNVYDAQHMSDMVDVVARALAKVAPVYVRDSGAAEPRPLQPAELEGATIRRGATILVLADGRSFSSATIKRLDLRQAIAILKAVGIPELQGKRKPAERPEPKEAGQPNALASMAEIEKLLRLPLTASQVQRANALAVAIARGARQGRVANLAMQLMNTVSEASQGEEGAEHRVALAVARLRTALEEAERAG